MLLSKENLEKINEINEVLAKIDRFCATVVLYKVGSAFELNISVHQFLEEKDIEGFPILAHIVNKKIKLNNEVTTINKLNYVLDKMKELIIPSSKENN